MSLDPGTRPTPATTASPEAVAHARAVADAVLYEGYLLYPYRASSSKNQVRWQFGVAGPVGAAEAGTGEAATLAADILVRGDDDTTITIDVRYLQVQRRAVEQADRTSFHAVPALDIPGPVGPDSGTTVGTRVIGWDEAVECESHLGPFRLADLVEGAEPDVGATAGRDLEHLHDAAGNLAGRLVRTREQLEAVLGLRSARTSGQDLWSIALDLRNVSTEADDAPTAVAHSLLGAHAIVAVEGGRAVSTVDPPDDAVDAAATCRHDRWWPVLAGPPGELGLVLVTPIIVEDHAELAPESKGALFDSTEIDEILTLRILTMTDVEKAEARSTDPRAAAIIDRCEQMTQDDLAMLHGALRSPRGALDPWAASRGELDLPPALEWGPDAAPARQHVTEISDVTERVFETSTPWWDPEADASVSPEHDSVLVDGVELRRGSIVRVQPSRRADAQDLFFAGMTATVAAVLRDVDGETHVAVTLVDDPAADLHEWYGRYLYFAPDELVPTHAHAEAGHEGGGS